jgi:hypothetical protein
MPGLWTAQHVSRLERSARAHEKNFEFDEAAHLYFRAASLEGPGQRRYSNLMRAASCKERAQNWRQQSGLWERLAYELAKTTDVDFSREMESFRDRTKEPGQFGIFHIISYREWASPTSRLVHLVKGKEQESLHWLQRAWAYQWAAEEAEASGRLSHAARLWRLAGLCFINEACPLEDRLRQAARSFLHAATSTLRSAEWEPMPFVATLRWNAITIDWGDPETRESVNREVTASGKKPDKKRTDLEWHEHAWCEYLKHIGDADRKAALEERARELKQLQQMLISVGDRHHSVQAYQARMRTDIQLCRLSHRWMRLVIRQLYYSTTLSGSSVRRPLLIALAINAGVLPLIYWSTGVAHAGVVGAHRASFADTLILSLSSLVSFSTSRAHIVAQWASALQALQALSGYFILAFILWVAQRFSE